MHMCGRGESASMEAGIGVYEEWSRISKDPTVAGPDSVLREVGGDVCVEWQRGR